MSWLAVLFKLPNRFVSVHDIPNDFVSEPLGSRAAVLAILAEVFPDANFADPTWVRVERPNYVIECIVGREEPVESLGFRPHGDDTVIEALELLCAQTGWRAFDTSSGDLITFAANPAQGFQAWRADAQRVIGPSFDPRGVPVRIPERREPPSE
jgi:hypothetical protein